MTGIIADVRGAESTPLIAFRFSKQWKEFLFLSFFYLACAMIATWPRVARMESTLPTLADPVQHLTVLRWYRSCLFEGRSPFRLDGLQWPVGATLGSFSPLIAQATLFVPLSIFIKNDCLIYNILWFFGLSMTGVCSYSLIKRFNDDRLASAIGGLGVSLSGPVLAHAHGHLELIYIGSAAIFLATWVDFVEKPSRATLFRAVFSYWLTTACAAYNAVLCVAPAVWFVVVEVVSAGRNGGWKRLKSRVVWLSAFSIVSLPGLGLLLAGPIWSAVNGVSLTRSLNEFRRYGSPPWSLVAPPAHHPLCVALKIDPYEFFHYSWIESESYLGIVILLLLGRAAIVRTRFRRRGYWWSCLALLLVLSFGVEWKFERFVVPLPGLLLWKALPIFRLIRVPARFNLLAVLAASVIASASLRDLLARCDSRRKRLAIVVVAAVVMLAELGTLNFTTDRLPNMPKCYQMILRIDPSARFYEAPAYGSGYSEVVTACTGYWQAFHRAKTSGGYSGVPNAPFDARVGYNSPFDGRLLEQESFLSDPEHVDFGVVEDVDARDALWLFMRANDLSHIVLHRWIGSGGEAAPGALRWAELIGDAKVYEDADAVVFAANRLRTPKRPVLLPTTGWIGASPFWKKLFTNDRADWAVCGPRPTTRARLVLVAKARRGPILVRLERDGKELARWTVEEGDPRTLTSPPLSLSGGVERLTIRVDRPLGSPLLEIDSARWEPTEAVR